MHPFFERLSQKVHPAILAGAAAAVLIGGYALIEHLKNETARLQMELLQLVSTQEQSALAANHFGTLADLKKHDVMLFKDGLATSAQSNKTLFETGLSLHEEKRLLEKQWDILTTYLNLDTALQRVFLMRGDQVLESYFIGYVPLKAFAGAPTSLPRSVRIISKERFAHPERGNAEVINGKLQWEPPQVGQSIRSNALGEYVLFTNSKLILHGPPKNPVDHEAFPHVCVGLSREAAQNLYQHSFIGSKLLLPIGRDAIMSVASDDVSFDSATHDN